ncbi:MAG: hypothetical protein R3B47_09110 [Bacteroidia bacterium]
MLRTNIEDSIGIVKNHGKILRVECLLGKLNRCLYEPARHAVQTSRNGYHHHSQRLEYYQEKEIAIGDA